MNAGKVRPGRGLGLTPREAATAGPLALKKVEGSVQWCWQVVEYLKNQVRHVGEQYRQVEQVLDTLVQAKAWDVIEPEKPYGSLEAMLRAELGEDKRWIEVAEHHERLSTLVCGPDSYTDYRSASITNWGEAGGYLHDVYAEHRDLYPGLPESLPIVVGITAYGHCLGLTRGRWEHGPRISIFSAHFRRGRHAVRDVLLHEMLHADLMLRGLDPSHDSDDWYAAVRKLSPVLLNRRLDVKRGGDKKSTRVPNPNYDPNGDTRKTLVRKVRVPDAIPHGDVARWPQAFRPAGYDWGEPIPCPTY